MNLWKRLTSHFTGNEPTQEEKGAPTRACAPRVPYSAPSPNTSSSPRSSGRESAPILEPQRGSSIQPGVGTPVPTLGSGPNDPFNPERVESKPSNPSSAGGEDTPNSKFKTQHSTFDDSQPSPFEDLAYNRNGKIARLSRALRDRINLALYNRYTAKDLCRALNQMPEVQAVMAQYFNGKPLRQQNISEWKLGGYRDWLHHRQLLEQQRELAADAKDLAGTAEGMTESLFGILNLNYAHLLMNRDKETPEEFETKRKELSLVSHDISRMHRCHINTRRVEVQEARLERDEEKTTEQLHFKFAEWAQNPAIRRAFILEPMEANRRSRQHFGMPPTADDILVEQLTKDDPYFNPPNKKPAKNRPIPAEKGGASVPASRPDKTSDDQKQDDSAGTRSSASAEGESASNSESKTQNSTLPPNPYGDKTTSQIIAEIESGRTAVPPVSDPKSEPSSPSASEKTSEAPKQEGTVGTRCHASEPQKQEGVVGPRSSAAAGNEGAPNSKLKIQNSTLPKTCSSASKTTAAVPQPASTPNAKPKPPLSDYERALREGKTFLEALYIHSARPKSANADLPGRSPAQRDEARPSDSRPPGASAWDSFSQPVLPSPYASLASFKFRFG